ncbi:MAG TPA: hypothetical protein VFQ86_13825 [Arachidicoccus soli]|nr:hypothetical protein [Arachidicoccus soli]
MHNSYKPYHIVLFILGCLFLLGSLVLFVPSGKLNIFGYQARFISQKKLIQGKQKIKLDINTIIAGIDTTAVIQKDSANNADSLLQNFTIKKDNSLLYNNIGKEKLRLFFQHLKKAKSNKIRILHYGDSQIEGDRMTAFFRERMQEKFGGFGPGFIPAVNIYGTISYIANYSPNFMRYTNFRGKQLKFTKDYGILNTVGRFTEEIKDTSGLYKLPLDTAWITIAPGTATYYNTENYNNVALYYTDAKTKCALNIYENGHLIRHDSLITDGNYHVDSLSFQKTPGILKFEFIGKVSPTILGFSLDGKNGVQVDNVAMRGSSGLFLEKSNRKLFRKMLVDAKVKLFIMQFGGNAVPYIKDSAQARGVVYRFKLQLQILQRLQPDAAIVVIGPSDMSRIADEEYVSYPILPYYISRLKDAATSVGAAYFNTYKAMGGENSMIQWVKHDLAHKDYTHFTRKGAKIVSQQFYNAFMKAYLKLSKGEK